MTNQSIVDSTATIKINKHIATITINRPEAMNALDPDTLERLAEIWLEVRENDDIWVAIITGAGEQSFCAAADLKKPSRKVIKVILFKAKAYFKLIMVWSYGSQ